MSLPNIDYELYNDLTVILGQQTTKYIRVAGVNAKVVGNVIILNNGAKATVSYALESPTYVTQSGLTDSDLVWTDFQSVSGTIITISGSTLPIEIKAPNIIRIQNTTSGNDYNVKFNFRGNRA